ncbi:hypothetical protein EJ05DRAFT_471496 [Pseudovirgaria hyperparasitica]|uniref:Uncharacterized protein n=1 Tax=Pseudovirgaria hyperparasitica TaxID=470096 RepID=A0A6A6WJM1_9PEZI|nr:uncharacterized protein EJ05DRAFT_471496 [Pseudovirgaria hyperparasitica]KAF2762484.1 hypothetical protein EJ05DRAFT_471496 [Pseudovirgaria hyperparasitica]
MVANINQITQLSQDLQPIASSIQTGETVIAKRQQNPFEPVIRGFSEIINVAQRDIENMDGTGKYPDAEAQQVCNAFSTFVVVHQRLLNIVIGKSGLLEGIFLGPVAAVLRSLESTVDTLAFGIIDSVPGCQADATTKLESLDVTLGKAVCAYTPGGSLGVNVFC